MNVFEKKSGVYLISTDKAKLHIPVIHKFLTEDSYWNKGITLNKVERCIEHSLCFGMYENSVQIGFARIISDFTTFAYLADVFILPDYRGRGCSKMLVAAIMEHPELLNLRRWVLATSDAHGLYKQFGWQPLSKTEKWMEIFDPNFNAPPQSAE